MASQIQTHFGVAWYKPFEWEKLLRIVSDAEVLELTHREWLKAAKKTFRELQADGIDPKRVIVAVDELVAWCHDNKVPIDAPARSQFTAYKPKGM